MSQVKGKYYFYQTYDVWTNIKHYKYLCPLVILYLPFQTSFQIKIFYLSLFIFPSFFITNKLNIYKLFDSCLFLFNVQQILKTCTNKMHQIVTCQSFLPNEFFRNLIKFWIIRNKSFSEEENFASLSSRIIH